MADKYSCNWPKLYIGVFKQKYELLGACNLKRWKQQFIHNRKRKEPFLICLMKLVTACNRSVLLSSSVGNSVDTHLQIHTMIYKIIVWIFSAFLRQYGETTAALILENKHNFFFFFFLSCSSSYRLLLYS